jgi:RNA polymerase sigma-70 factor (ECF subfamily)
MAASESFAEIMARLRAGDQAAASEVFRRFVDKLVRLAKRQFNAVMRRRVDPEDVVQSAYKSFFLRYGAGKLAVHDWGNLWGLLTVITLRKCYDQVEHHKADRRNVQRDATPPGSSDTGSWWDAVDREPTPEEAAVLGEMVEQLLRDSPESERPVIELSLQGYTAREISQRIGRAERSVRRLREQVRKRLENFREM